MVATFSGPMFDPAETDLWRSIFGKEGGHYNIKATRGAEAGMRFLRGFDGADELNLVFFSTGGVHGSYATIEDVRAGKDLPHDDDRYRGDSVTFLLVQPRLVGMTYGECRPESDADWGHLLRLRAETWAAAARIGRPE